MPEERADDDPRPVRGFRRLVRHSAGYAVGAVVGKGVGILLLPLVTRALQPAEFGQLEVLSMMQSAVGSVLLLGMEVGSTRLYADLDDVGRRRMFATWSVILLGLTTVVMAALWYGRSAISEALFDDTALAAGVALVGVAIFGSTYQQVGLTVLRNHERPVTFARTSSFAFIAYAVLVLLALVDGVNVNQMMFAMTGGLLVGGFASMFAARRSIAGKPSGDLGRRLLRISLPVLPAVVALGVTELATRTILLRTGGAVEVGWLSLALRFSSIGLLVVIAFQMAWQVEAFSIGKDEPGRYRIAQDGRRILVAVAAASVAIGAFAPELIRLLGGDAFLPALPAVCGALVFAIAFGAYSVVTMRSALASEMRDLGLSASLGAIVAIGLTLVLAPVLASGGTAAAMAAGQFVAVGLAVAVGWSRAPVPFEWGRLALTVVIASLAIAAATLPSGGAPLAARMAILALFGLYLVVEGTGREVVVSVSQLRESRRASPRS